MTDRLDIWLGHRRIGSLNRPHGQLSISYDPDWVADPHAFPLSNSLPLSLDPTPIRATENYLRGLLPDDDRVVREWARRFGVRPGSTFGLMENIGSDVAGAFSFLPEGRSPEEGELLPVSEDDLEERVELLTRNASRWAPGRSLGRFSLAGAQAKFALHLGADGQWYEPTGLQPSTHIFKPSLHPEFDMIGPVEAVSMSAARNVGIPTSHVETIRLAGIDVLLVTRFDRVRNSAGSVRRVHQEDLAQATGTAPANKYSADGGPNASQSLAAILERSADQETDAVAFAQALAFTVVMRGTDAHAKNYAILHGAGGSRLAPMYDQISYLPFLAKDEPDDRLRAAMSIGGESRLSRISLGHFARIARENDIDPGLVVVAARSVLGQTAEGLDAALRATSVIPDALAKRWREGVEKAADRALGASRDYD